MDIDSFRKHCLLIRRTVNTRFNIISVYLDQYLNYFQDLIDLTGKYNTVNTFKNSKSTFISVYICFNTRFEQIFTK